VINGRQKVLDLVGNLVLSQSVNHQSHVDHHGIEPEYPLRRNTWAVAYTTILLLDELNFCGIFYDAVSTSEYTVSNGGTYELERI
jgi:hypothetical protein